MTTLRIAAKLNFINRQKIAPQAVWHRLNGADPIGSARRHNPFLACDHRNHARPFDRNNPVVNFACKQTQRQANHTCAMRQHAFNRIMGFTGICRPKNGRHTGILHIFPDYIRGQSRLKRLPLQFQFKPVCGLLHIYGRRVQRQYRAVDLQCIRGAAQIL